MNTQPLILNEASILNCPNITQTIILEFVQPNSLIPQMLSNSYLKIELLNKNNRIEFEEEIKISNNKDKVKINKTYRISESTLRFVLSGESNEPNWFIVYRCIA